MTSISAITYKLSGRLGNHLQLWACARTMSLRYGWKFLYRPIIHGSKFLLSEHYQGNQPQRMAMAWFQIRRRLVRLGDHSWDETFNVDGSVCARMRNLGDKLFVLDWGGIFKQVDRFRDTLIRELLGDHDAAIRAQADPTAVGVHIRRSDAQYPQPMSYYVNAIMQVELTLGQHAAVHVFSDGPIEELAAELKGFLPQRELVLHTGGVVEDLLALATFRTIIISMSWFSYWSAFLSHDATVYCPVEFQYYPHWQPVRA